MKPTTVANTAKTRILIVDDKEQVRRDLRTALGLMEGLEIVGEAADGIEAVHQAETLKPDVVLMDLKMPRMDGFEAARQIKDRHLVRGIVALLSYPSCCFYWSPAPARPRYHPRPLQPLRRFGRHTSR
jgi:CheY-like chemotaxis protein